MHPPKVAVFDVSDRHVDNCHKVQLGSSHEDTREMQK